MKKISLLILVTLTAQISQAAQINCWLTSFKEARVPFMKADIVSENEIGNIKFLYKKHMSNSGVTLKDHADAVEGVLIESNRSPYKGQVRYFVRGAGEIILPLDLSNESLKAIEKEGIGYGRNENGVLITNFDDGGDGAGSHVSYRLSCRSNL